MENVRIQKMEWWHVEHRHGLPSCHTPNRIMGSGVSTRSVFSELGLDRRIGLGR